MTAVEKLVSKLFNPEVPLDEDIYNAIEEAKEMDKEQKIALGKRCFYKGFEKAESDDANCFTAWREEAKDLLTFKSE